jgi:hypothetical protein
MVFLIEENFEKMDSFESEKSWVRYLFSNFTLKFFFSGFLFWFFFAPFFFFFFFFFFCAHFPFFIDFCSVFPYFCLSFRFFFKKNILKNKTEFGSHSPNSKKKCMFSRWTRNGIRVISCGACGPAGAAQRVRGFGYCFRCYLVWYGMLFWYVWIDRD